MTQWSFLEFAQGLLKTLVMDTDIMTWPGGNGDLFLLSGLLAAHLLGADVVVEGEEAVEEDHQPHQGRRQQPSRVESWNFEM